MIRTSLIQLMICVSEVLLTLNLYPAISTFVALNASHLPDAPRPSAHSPLFRECGNLASSKMIIKNPSSKPVASLTVKSLRQTPMTSPYVTPILFTAARGAARTVTTGQWNESFDLDDRTPRRTALAALCGIPVALIFTLMHDIMDVLPRNIAISIKHQAFRMFPNIAPKEPTDSREAYRQKLNQISHIEP